MNQIQHTHIVPEHIRRIRFSDYVLNVFKEYIPSRKGMKKAIKRGDFLIDGVVATTGRWVQPGQKIDLLFQDMKPRKIFKLEMNIPWEDDSLAVVHKPAGFVVSGNKFMTIQNALIHNLSLSKTNDALQLPRPVHRLDRSTSGLLLVAKTASAAMKLGHQFENKQVFKRYRAIVTGKTPANGTIDSPVDNRQAQSEFQFINCDPSLKYQWLSRVDLFPLTGRRHQLRIHMAQLGHPVAGDKLYGIEGMTVKRQGLFLCAVEIRFKHPENGEEIAVTIDEPAKFEKLMERERKRFNSAGATSDA